ncbi:MAG: hypothetical protein ACT443_13970 [Gemmatimonadota bacterium]
MKPAMLPQLRVSGAYTHVLENARNNASFGVQRAYLQALFAQRLVTLVAD